MLVVTGGAGFIGSALVWALNQRGRTDVLVVDSLAAQGRWKNLRRRGFIDVVSPQQFLKQLESDKFVAPIEGILHMGAITETSSDADAEAMYQSNTRYTAELAHWAIEKDIRYVYASSAAVYGDGTLGFSDDDGHTPNLTPLNPYAFSKWAFDRRVLAEGWDKKIAGLRFFNVFGPNEYHKGRMASVVWHSVNQVRDTGRIKLFQSHRADYANGGQRRDFIYVKDVCDVVLWFLNHPAANGVFNLGTGKSRTYNDLASAIFAALAAPSEIEYIPTPESYRHTYQYYTQADLTKLRAVGCDHVFPSLEDTIEDYVRRYLVSESGPYL